MNSEPWRANYIDDEWDCWPEVILPKGWRWALRGIVRRGKIRRRKNGNQR